MITFPSSKDPRFKRLVDRLSIDGITTWGSLFFEEFDSYIHLEADYSDDAGQLDRSKKFVTHEALFSVRQIEITMGLIEKFYAASKAPNLLGYFRGTSTCSLGEENLEWYPQVQFEIGDLLALALLPRYCCLPDFWWPATNEWFFHHNIDLAYAIVGGSKEFTSRFKDAWELRALDLSCDKRWNRWELD